MVETQKKRSRKRNQELPWQWNLFDYFKAIMSMINDAAKSGAVEILFFNPLQSRHLRNGGELIQRGPKYILRAADKGIADALRKQLDAVPSPLSLRQNIVCARGDLLLSIKSAYSSRRVDINAVIRRLRRKLEESEDSFKENLPLQEALNKLIQWRDELGNDAPISRRCECGKSWRVTWFDPERERRCQAGLGDIFFVYGDNVGQVREAPERRKRTDCGDEHVICKLDNPRKPIDDPRKPNSIECIDRSKH